MIMLWGSRRGDVHGIKPESFKIPTLGHALFIKK